MSFNKERAEEFYIMALMDISDGVSLVDLEEVIKEYEKAEMYEACAGILKALHEAQYYSIDNINKRLNDK